MAKTKYKNIINGIAANFNNPNNITAEEIITYRISFPLKPNFLNLSENKGNSAIIKNDIIQQNAINNHGLKKTDIINSIMPGDVTPENQGSIIKGMEAISIALAGVGNPINDSVCRTSLLNFARRKAEKTGISSPAYANFASISGANMHPFLNSGKLKFWQI